VRCPRYKITSPVYREVSAAGYCLRRSTEVVRWVLLSQMRRLSCRSIVPLVRGKFGLVRHYHFVLVCPRQCRRKIPSSWSARNFRRHIFRPPSDGWFAKPAQRSLGGKFGKVQRISGERIGGRKCRWDVRVRPCRSIWPRQYWLGSDRVSSEEESSGGKLVCLRIAVDAVRSRLLPLPSFPGSPLKKVTPPPSSPSAISERPRRERSTWWPVGPSRKTPPRHGPVGWCLQNEWSGMTLALALVIEANAAVFYKRVGSEVGVAVTLVAAPWALVVNAGFRNHCLFGALSYRPSRFLPRALVPDQCKRKSTSKQKGYSKPKKMRSNANTHSDLISKGKALTLASMATSPDFPFEASGSR